MKKITSLFLITLLLAAVLTIFAMPAYAASEPTASGLCGGDGEVHWELYDDTATLRIWGHGNMKDYDDYDETPWYEYDARNTVKHIVVEDGITSIGSYAFAKFYYVEDISLGNDIFGIHDYAFWQATYYSAKDVNLVIPSTTYEIREGAFYEAMHLKTVNIKSDRDTYPWYVTDDWGIQGLEIGMYAFYDCENIDTLTIGNIEKPNNMTVKLGYGSFEYCESLHTIHFADSLALIGEAAFYDCPALRNINYYGTQEQFEQVDIDENWNDDLLNATKDIHYFDVGIHTYIDEDGNTATLDGSKVRCRILTDNIKELTGGWYIVNSDISYGERIHVTEDSNILLLDRCGIETSRGIGVNNTKLGIYAQSLDENTMGYINVTDSEAYCAGIGGGKGVKKGTVMICGGNIDAEGNRSAAAIGSGQDGNCEVIIKGGIVTGRGYSCGAGIGSGESYSLTAMLSDCSVTIWDGIVTGYGGNYAAGIGSGPTGDCEVIINGGIVTGYGGDDAAGIGSGKGLNEKRLGNGSVSIYGGTVSAEGGCIGIGSGVESSCDVKILGGNISGDIGSGANGSCSISVSDKAIINDGIGVGDPGTCRVYDENGKKIGSVISEGNIWIIIAVVIVAAGVAFFVIKKKKAE